MTDLVGRKVRLTGTGWRDLPSDRWRTGQIRTVTKHLRAKPGHAEAVAFGGDVLGFPGGSGSYSVEVLPARERIHVLAWGVPESSAGFDWVPVDRDPGGEANLRRVFDLNVVDDEFEGYIVLAELHVAGYAPDAAGRARVTDYIEGELQDAIGRGLVGKILGRY